MADYKRLYNTMQQMVDKYQNEIVPELRKEIEKIAKERDAAVRDLTLYPCFSCNNNQSRTHCNDCLRNRSNALDAAGKFLPDNYEWRGVCESNGGKDGKETKSDR